MTTSRTAEATAAVTPIVLSVFRRFSSSESTGPFFDEPVDDEVAFPVVLS